jgi:hypothetical protein
MITAAMATMAMVDAARITRTSFLPASSHKPDTGRDHFGSLHRFLPRQQRRQDPHIGHAIDTALL